MSFCLTKLAPIRSSVLTLQFPSQMFTLFILSALALIQSIAAGNTNNNSIPVMKEGALCGVASPLYKHYGVMVGCEEECECSVILADGNKVPEIRCVRREIRE